MFNVSTRACLLLLVAASLSSVGTGQPPDGSKTKTERPTITVFPDLKPRSWETIKGGTAAPFPPSPKLPADAPPLLKVRFEQLQEGLAYLSRVEEIIRVGAYDGRFFREYLNMAADTFRLASEFQEKPADRIPWIENHVLRLKEFEQYVELRVTNGFDPPHNLNAARFSRLQAEADLLKLKAEVEKTGGK